MHGTAFGAFGVSVRGMLLNMRAAHKTMDFNFNSLCMPL